MIELFRSNHPDSPARLVEGYFEDFDTDERFDVIVMGFILEHVDDPGLLLARYRRLPQAGRPDVCGGAECQIDESQAWPGAWHD
ncbi:class I SAM-dependent methyltransferase [Cupriavidus basilensis]